MTQSAAQSREPEALPRSTILIYCLPMLGVGFMAMPFYVWLMKFSTDVLLIAPAAIGSIFFIGRFWDAVSDPLAGYLSDRTNAPSGRRRSWMLASAIPLALTTVMLWSPPWMLEGLALVLWMGGALLLYETASTAFFVPYGALGMELTERYRERTRLFGYRHVIAAVGSLAGLGVVYLLRTAENPRLMALVVSAASGVVMAFTILYSARRLPERDDYRGRGSPRLLKAFGDVLRNPHGRLLFLVYGIETFGAASIGMLAPYVMQYVVHAPELNEVFIVTYFVPQFALTPLWIWLGNYFSKKSLWLFSMTALTLGYSAIFFTSESSFGVLFLVIFLLGLGGGCGAVVAPAIQADVIDYDEYLTGERKEGAYTAIWNFIRKSAAGVTAGITGFVLQYAGYVPNAPEQSEAVQTAILALIGLLPAACYAIGTLMFMRFGLNEREHEEIIKVLRQRAAGVSAGPEVD
ncbi:MAG: MFS transporter [Myxococcales bacterium]|nr:MFS transporter [Myxococcales bacterium]